MSDTPYDQEQDDDRGGDQPAGEHPDEPDVPEQPPPPDDEEPAG